MNKKEMILEHLMTGQYINKYIAESHYQCTFLPVIISELRAEGYTIKKTICRRKTGEKIVDYTLGSYNILGKNGQSPEK